MTGETLTEYALEQCNSSRSAVDSNSTSFDAWALRTTNFVAGNAYYFIQSRLSREERETEVSVHDLNPYNKSDYPQGAQDVNLLQPELEIVRLYVKYQSDAEPVKAEFISLNSLPYGMQFYAKQSGGSPFYSILNDRIQIAPKPEKVVTGGIIVHQQRGYQPLESLDQEIVGVPSDFQDILIPAMQVKIYQRLRRYDDMNAMQAQYEEEKKAMIRQLSGRAGRKSRIFTRVPFTL